MNTMGIGARVSLITIQRTTDICMVQYTSVQIGVDTMTYGCLFKTDYRIEIFTNIALTLYSS